MANTTIFGQMNTVNKYTKSQEKGKFQGNTIYVSVILLLKHANSTLKQPGHQIKGGHFASSPALTAEHTEGMSLPTVKYWR